jgi:hypothetical protein
VENFLYGGKVMALLKKFQYPNGTETNYHKIGEIRIVPIADKIIYVEKEPEVVIEEVVGEEIPEELTLFNEGTEATGEEPVDPETPTDPEEPVEPETPVGPEEPIGPEEPVEPQPEVVPVVVKQVSVMAQVLSYVSQEVRETGAKNHLTSQLYYFTISMEELVAADIMKICYSLVKTLPDFADAENI